MGTKITDNQMYDLIKEECAHNETIIEWCTNKQALLTKKAEKARLRAAEKKAVGDDFYATVCACVSEDDFMSIEDVFNAVLAVEPEATFGKVRARLVQAYRNGIVDKTKVMVEGKPKTLFKKFA